MGIWILVNVFNVSGNTPFWNSQSYTVLLNSMWKRNVQAEVRHSSCEISAFIVSISVVAELWLKRNSRIEKLMFAYVIKKKFWKEGSNHIQKPHWNNWTLLWSLCLPYTLARMWSKFLNCFQWFSYRLMVKKRLTLFHLSLSTNDTLTVIYSVMVIEYSLEKL